MNELTAEVVWSAPKCVLSTMKENHGLLSQYTIYAEVQVHKLISNDDRSTISIDPNITNSQFGRSGLRYTTLIIHQSESRMDYRWVSPVCCWSPCLELAALHGSAAPYCNDCIARGFKPIPALANLSAKPFSLAFE